MWCNVKPLRHCGIVPAANLKETCTIYRSVFFYMALFGPFLKPYERYVVPFWNFVTATRRHVIKFMLWHVLSLLKYKALWKPVSPATRGRVQNTCGDLLWNVPTNAGMYFKYTMVHEVIIIDDWRHVTVRFANIDFTCRDVYWFLHAARYFNACWHIDSTCRDVSWFNPGPELN